MQNILNKNIILFSFAALMILVSSCSNKSKTENTDKNSFTGKTENILPEDIVKFDNLPPLGKWMYTSQKGYADWLGAKLNKKSLREPVNVIIVDSVSKSSDEAKDNLIRNFDTAGFKVRAGHSGGYLGYIENGFYTQLPGQSGYAFSDAPFEMNNCHGRIFGPCEVNGVYYFTGSLSKEKVAIDIPIHHYDSFNEARDKLATNLNQKSGYKIISYINMQNAIDSDSLTTGDHDGKGVLLSISK